MTEQWEQDSKTEATHPIKNARWVKVIARIRKNVTGEVRDYATNAILDHGDEFPHPYIWEDGNYGCDCNRALFFGYAIGQTYEEVGEHPCGENGYSVQLLNAVTGKPYYDEAAAG